MSQAKVININLIMENGKITSFVAVQNNNKVEYCKTTDKPMELDSVVYELGDYLYQAIK